jgi:acylphosphatase
LVKGGKMSEQTIRKEIKFTGDVQGVGFRYRAKYAAGGFGITGWVRNESDGTVLMEAQGTEEQINQMLRLINQSPYITIHGINYRDLPVVEHERGFHVRGY